ncbi:hypothetical protein CMQ_1810 [Grosmannia clavigera kw1407]|uniref:C6 zinc finger domain containing protein n=1 Tax=Grosmannia clavigera (strain kw1407 / UAMH 11150) TaxID=655863 RepID=F0XAX7_GROCL|nr:uncharacterized protein CMQ_1810 [Grosmannia clavigera kw1407]EFX05174.1 hypothetical protein CMQ_1810 [Grosmannia clavigera kw1407]
MTNPNSQKVAVGGPDDEEQRLLDVQRAKGALRPRPAGVPDLRPGQKIVPRIWAETVGRRLFVNTTGWDIELYRQLSQQSEIRPALLMDSVPLLRQPPPSTVQNTDLLGYFHNVAYLSLVTFSGTAQQIRDMLLRMALSDGGGHDMSGRALLYSLLAVASVRRSGVQPEAIRLKVAALEALRTAVRQQQQQQQQQRRGVKLGSAAPIVAASMLLCSYEIELPSASSGEWLWHVQGAIGLVRETQLEQQLDSDIVGDDENMLVEWAYYHATLSRFSMQHWRHGSQGEYFLPTQPCRKPTLAVLNFLDEACGTIIDPRDLRSNETAYRERLRTLQLRVQNFPAATSLMALSSVTPWSEADRTVVAVELFRVATLVYLVRAGTSWASLSVLPSTSPSPPPPPIDLDALVATIYDMPLQMHPSCDHFFPLLIIGGEARSDEQRATVLAMVERTERMTQARSMQRLKAGLQAVWAQVDLHADGDLVLNYFRMMDAVVSANRPLPSYV